MDLAKFKKKLNENNISTKFISLNETKKDHAMNFEKLSDEEWKVYYRERGVDRREYYFRSESDALIHLFNEVNSDSWFKK